MTAANQATGRVLIENIGQLVTLSPLAKEKRVHSITRDDLGLVENAWITLFDGKVSGYGQGKYQGATDAVKRIDAKGGLVMPGLIDCHTHPIFAGSRAAEFAQRLDGKTYQEIAASGGGIVSTVSATREASQETLLELARGRLSRMLSHGVTTCEVKSGYGLSVAEELKLLRVGKQLKSELAMHLELTCLALHAVPRDASSKQAFIDSMSEELLPAVKEQELATWVDAFVEHGYFLPEECESYIARAKELGFGVRIHADEFKNSKAALAAARWQAASADHLECTDINAARAMAKAGTIAVLLPGTSLYCRMPYTQAALFREAGCGMAIATDYNPGSCRFDNLSFIATLAALHCGLTVAETVAAVSYVAATSLRLSCHKGSLAPGYDADLVIFSHPDVDHWLADAGRRKPYAVLIAGEWTDV